MRASAVDQIIDGGGADIVTRLAALPENQWFERKSGRIRPKDLAEDLIAFANAEGGTIVVGIHDGRSDPPLPARTNDLRQAAHDLTVPTVRVHAEEVHVGEGATLLLLRVAPGEQVHETRSGECFLRVGDETKRLSFGQRQELEYAARHARNPRIARVCSDLGIAQELGEGIRRIYAEVRARGLTDPVYTQTQAGVRLVLSAADAIPAGVLAALPRGATDTLAALRIAGRPLGTGQIEELAGITRPTALKHLRALQSAGIIIWEGQSQRDPRATWRIA